jgi:hypothetical protein
MNAIPCVIPTLSVAIIYLIWRSYERFQWRKDRVLRERVTYMLWVMAQGATELE